MPAPSTGSTKRSRANRAQGTIAENRLWYCLRNRQLNGHKFVRQLPIGPYIVDLACREAGLVIEVDGGQHSESRTDPRRTAYLNAEGYSVLRFWNNDVIHNRDGVLSAIADALQTGTPSPDLRFAPATLSPTGRGMRGQRAAWGAQAANEKRQTKEETGS